MRLVVGAAVLALHVGRPSLLANAPREASDRMTPLRLWPTRVQFGPVRLQDAVAALSRCYARLAQELTKRWIVVVWQPSRTESYEFIISRNWSEHNLWKWCCGGGFARKANAEAHGHKVHQRVAPNIELLHLGGMRAVGQPAGEPPAKCWVALGLAHNEVLIAQIRPPDLFPFT